MIEDVCHKSGCDRNKIRLMRDQISDALRWVEDLRDVYSKVNGYKSQILIESSEKFISQTKEWDRLNFGDDWSDLA